MPLKGLRRAAMEEFKRAGVEYFVVDDSDFGASDFRGNAALWGIKEVSQTMTVRLYHVE
jgi:hypothetical protein